MDVLSSVSWFQFIAFMVIVLVLWYGCVFLMFFRKPGVGEVSQDHDSTETGDSEEYSGR